MSNLALRAMNNEIQLLYRCEAIFKVPAAPIIRQLVAETERPLPDRFPPVPERRSFQWPELGLVDFQAYWHSREWNPWAS